MRLIDADKICVIPAEDDNITGMGMTREEQDAYNEGIDAVMEKIRNAKTADPYKDVLEIIDKVGRRAEVGDMDAYEVYTEIRYGVLALKGGHG